MKLFCHFLLTFILFLCSCSGLNYADQHPVSFESYLKSNDPALTDYMAQSSKKRQKKMAEAFSYLDKAASTFEKEKTGYSRKNLYTNTQKVIDDLYLEYIKRQTTEPLDTLAKDLNKKMRAHLEKSGEFTEYNIEKFLIYETRKQAELEFDQEFEQLFPNSSAKNNLKGFLNEYTMGFFILKQNNPEEFQQFCQDIIANFETYFYILMKNSLTDLSSQNTKMTNHHN